jgi:phage shock protein PspC (stress-responsive transcriptional regulator)
MDATGPTPDDGLAHLECGDVPAAVTRPERSLDAPTDRRKELCRSLRQVAADRPSLLPPVCATLAAFLDVDARPVRLSTVKLFVAVAAADPDAVVPVVDALAVRLADEDCLHCGLALPDTGPAMCPHCGTPR